MEQDNDMEWTRNWNKKTFVKYTYSTSPYSDIQITCNTAQRKFQHRYKLVAPLPDKNYDMQSFDISQCHWNCSPNDVLVELEIQVWG